MKTLLVNPHPPRTGEIKKFVKPYPPTIPLGLAYIAAVLEKEHEVKVLDNVVEKLSPRQIRALVSKESPDVVGITTGTYYYDSAKEIAAIVKAVNPETRVVVGGPHPSLWPQRTLSFECFDYAVCGEGEATSAELWDALEKNSGVRKLKEVKGIAFRTAFKKKTRKKSQGRRSAGVKVFVTSPRPLIHDLNALPWPARHLFPMNKYDKRVPQLPAFPAESISTSRGCPFSCRFCTTHMVFGRGFRGRSGESVGDELEFLASEYGAKGVCFREDEFTINKRRVLDICREIRKRGLDVQWLCESRVDTIDAEMARAMHGAGCRVIWFGIESGSQETLDFINKRITLEKVRNAVRVCKKAGIRCGGSFILGLPNEDLKMMQQTIDFAKSLDLDFAWFNIFKAFPAAELYSYVEEHGLIDKVVGEGIALIKTEHFDFEKMKEIQARAKREFYSSPRRLLKTLWHKIKARELTLASLMTGFRFAANAFLHRASDEFLD